jgi:hypothetical protein
VTQAEGGAMRKFILGLLASLTIFGHASATTLFINPTVGGQDYRAGDFFPVDSCFTCNIVHVSPVFTAPAGDTINLGTLTLGAYYFIHESVLFEVFPQLFLGPIDLSAYPLLFTSTGQFCDLNDPACDNLLSSGRLPSQAIVYDLSQTNASQLEWTGQVLAFSPGVPEPSIWALLLIGFTGLGFMGYRRRRSALA